MQELKKAILLTIYYINDENEMGTFNSRSYIKNIIGIIRGDINYKDPFGSYPTFGIMPFVVEDDGIVDLNVLCEDCYLCEKKDDLNRIYYRLTKEGLRIWAILNFWIKTNKSLYKEVPLYRIEDVFSSKMDANISDWFTRVLCNKDRAKVFSNNYIYSMADWNCVKDEIDVKGYVQIEDGYNMPYVSNEELSAIFKMREEKRFKVLRGESLSIKYKTPRSISRFRDYYPDFVLLTNDNKIAIIEIKQLVDFSNYINLSKYEALKEYCEKNGYMYCMVDKDFRCLTDVINRKVDKVVEKEFLHRINNQKIFETHDISEMRKKFGVKADEMLMDVQTLIIKHHLVNSCSTHGVYIDCASKERMAFDLE